MTLSHTIIIGIIEGLTEFLPVSSTAHIDIMRTLLLVPQSDFIKSFEIIIQLGAIAAVAFIFWRKLFSLTYIKKLFIAFVPTGIIGFLLYKLVKSFLLGNTYIAAIALLAGGIIIVIFEKYREKYPVQETESETIENFSFKQLITLGLAQALAVIPGVSRSGAVIISGRALGLSRMAITEFSFLLAVPTIFAATVYDIYKSGFGFSSDQWGIIGIGFIVSFVVAIAVIRWFLGYIRKHSFSVFGWYRIILGGVLILALFIGIL